MVIQEYNQEIEIWKNRADTIFIQPKSENITKEFAMDFIITTVANRFGNLKEKEVLIEKLKKQIFEIELSILAEKKGFILQLLNCDECPF